MYKRIRELRKKNGLSQVALSIKLEIDQSYYSKLELGKHKISLEDMIKIADFYHVSLDYLTERTDKMEVNK